MRRVLTVKEQAYPMKVVDVSRVANPSALDTVGGTVRTNGQPVDDVRKIVGTIPPAQMSPDVKLLQDDLINVTRDLAGAGDTATGQVNPESASGRAILAVQQASQAPMTEQKESYKKFIEDVARIWLEYLIVYAEDGVNLEQAEVDPMTGQEMVRVVNVPQAVLKQLKAVVKIDVTPRSPFDRFAQEQTIENLLVQGFFNAQRVGELDIYERVLPDDSVAPKRQIRDAINYVKEEQRKIAQIQARADMLMQNANNFISADPDGQAQQMVDARKKNMIRQLQMQQMAKKQTGESEVEKAEKALPDEN
jgi:DNA uptake protein ComE-like DNA-binding protein